MPDYIPYATVDECRICHKLVPVREFEGDDHSCLNCVGSQEWWAIRDNDWSDVACQADGNLEDDYE